MSTSERRMFQLPFEGSAKVEGETVKLELPIELQGRTLGISLAGERPEGHLRVAYLLSSAYGYHSSVPEHSSLIAVPDDLRSKRWVIAYHKASGEQRETELSCRVTEGRLHSLIMDTMETDETIAIDVTGNVVNSILDQLVLRTKLPLHVRAIDVFHKDTDKWLGRWQTVPYTIPVSLAVEDFEHATTTPQNVRPVLGLFREAIQ